jgi:hypothetical protein
MLLGARALSDFAAFRSGLGDHLIVPIGDQLFGPTRCKQLAGTLLKSSVDGRESKT